MTKSFTELDVWKSSHQFVLNVYRYTKQFPKSETYGLVSQFRRAAVSIPANIAEGYAKMGLKDKIRFYNIAQGSAEEGRYYLILSKDLEYVENSALRNEVDAVSKMLSGYISGTKRNY